jgi:hypothetical protein
MEPPETVSDQIYYVFSTALIGNSPKIVKKVPKTAQKQLQTEVMSSPM